MTRAAPLAARRREPARGPAPGLPALPRAGEVGGAQSIKRALAVLRYVASRPDGVRLRDVARDCGLNKATCHRILAALVEEGFLRFGDDGLAYGLGPEALAFGWSARARQDIPALARPGMMRLSEKSADTVFLSVRSGHEAICIAREVGSYPIKTLTLDVGSRRPLGVGSGSMALLAFAPPSEFASILDAVEPRLGAMPAFSRTILERLAHETRRLGYFFNEDMVFEGMSAVGVPVLGRDGTAIAALSVAAITPRMGEARRAGILQLLIDEARHLPRAMTGGAPPSE